MLPNSFNKGKISFNQFPTQRIIACLIFRVAMILAIGIAGSDIGAGFCTILFACSSQGGVWLINFERERRIPEDFVFSLQKCLNRVVVNKRV